MKKSVAILVYGESNATRSALHEEKYRELADSLSRAGYSVSSEVYNDRIATELADRLPGYDAVLVWVNPIEQGNDRTILDAMLSDLADGGCMVSTHPTIILKMGTKEVLYRTKSMDWGGDTEMYTGFESFNLSFPGKLKACGERVLKQYRGNGGNGIFKVTEDAQGGVNVIHATGQDQRTMTWERFFEEFRPFFINGGSMIDQEWNPNIANGMVRCYVSANKVAGFGYQEINALYEKDNKIIPPGKRYYYTENCGLFSDLKEIMESKWIPELKQNLEIPDNLLPVIWDADFFINSVNSPSAKDKYSLCEINVSCVSPFPPSAIGFMVTELGKRLAGNPI